MQLDFSDKNRSIRAQWAQYHATVPLRHKINHPPPSLPGHLGEWPENVGDDKDLPNPPALKPRPADGTAPIKNPKVAIVGAGAAGLFTAMILDYLNDAAKSSGFNVTYDIYEAAKDSSRLGGRLYTNKFTGKGRDDPRHNYFDVGAMRFPDASSQATTPNPIMKR